VDVIRKRALLAWVCCLWGALAACFWIRTGAPVESFARLEAAAVDGPVVTTDHGHAHDPAREPHSTPIEASESEECGEDGDVGEEQRHLQLASAPKRFVLLGGDVDCATPRDPCISQHNNRGPPRA
jgi:hypothetical protein